MERQAIRKWTVDYGNGPLECTVPHAWGQDVDVRWEGPAVYAASLKVPAEGGWLLFEGVSYAATVYLNGTRVLEHRGIWDAFSVPLGGHAGQEIEVRVEVVKNGGPSFPVRDVASGFLPYVFHTFGGIWRGVLLCATEPVLEPPAPPCRASVSGTRIAVDGKPFYLRGVLTWGWYPELGHPSPGDEEIRREVRAAKGMGFNTVKFCLWVPSHRFLEILEEEGLFAWLELPLWDPSPDPQLQEGMFEELRRIVLQYRRHSNIVAWTCGCELSSNTTAEFRKRLYDMVKELTGAALVKDNSGSSEMYGGDLREYGDFYDFHPYCDLPFYPPVLDSLTLGPREPKPILLGEFNDVDTHKDLSRIRREEPFWASTDPALNDRGVRWEPPPLPGILRQSRLAWDPDGNNDEFLRQDSWFKSCFIRKAVQEAVRSRNDYAGYVITGWRDTPISSAGMMDHWNRARGAEDVACWNGPDLLMLVPVRRPPWVHGGNRPGWRDAFNHFEGDVHLLVAGHFEQGASSTLKWQLNRVTLGEPKPEWGLQSGEGAPQAILPCEPKLLAELHLHDLKPGSYQIEVEFGSGTSSWMFNVFEKPNPALLEGWQLDDPEGLFEGLAPGSGNRLLTTRWSSLAASTLKNGGAAVWIVMGEGSDPMPFWRECMFETSESAPRLWSNLEFLSAVSGDRALSLDCFEALAGELRDIEVLFNRIDTRSYLERPIGLRARIGEGTLVATTLRPFGGLGIQPLGVRNNPAGATLLSQLLRLAG
jgi:hypothetical protein